MPLPQADSTSECTSNGLVILTLNATAYFENAEKTSTGLLLTFGAAFQFYFGHKIDSYRMLTFISCAELSYQHSVIL